MTINEALTKIESQLTAAGVGAARLDSQLLLAYILAKPKEFVLANDELELTPAQWAELGNLADRRAGREPLPYIIGRQEFYRLDFYVDHRVMIPRVESEKIVEHAIKYAPKNSQLIDVGTGSGALAIAVSKTRPDIEIWATDSSQDALNVAELNASSLLSNHRIHFLLTPLFDNLKEHFETVISNLPYVSLDYIPELKPESHQEPGLALFGGPGDGLDLYRQFFQDLPSRLNPPGYLFLESDPWQQPAIIDLAKSANLKIIEQDYLTLGFSKI